MIVERGDWMLDISEEWSEWFRPGMNWRNFTLIQVYYEDECYLGNRELLLRILGLGVRIVHIYDHGAEGRAIISDEMTKLSAAQAGPSSFEIAPIYEHPAGCACLACRNKVM